MMGARTAAVVRWSGRGSVLIFCAGLLAFPFLTPVARAGDDPSYLRPRRVGGVLAFGYNWNILGSSRAEQDAFDSPSQDYYFRVDRLDDARGDLEFNGRWDLPSFYKSLRLDLSYARMEWAHNSILGSNRYEIAARQKLPGSSQVDLTLMVQPQAYLRHRTDKDALPGEPRFRPEAVRRTEIEIAYSRALLASRAGILGGYEIGDRTRWFNERDEKSVSLGVFDRFTVAGDVAVTPRYGFDRTRSRNKPDLGSDRSYREHMLGLAVDRAWAIGPHSLETGVYGRLRLRTYTTSDPTDTSRFDREDRIYNWSLRAAYSMPRISPFFSVEHGGRDVRLPSGADVSDEEGEYIATLARVGIEWQITRE
jgi:hypothetical protein